MHAETLEQARVQMQLLGPALQGASVPWQLLHLAGGYDAWLSSSLGPLVSPWSTALHHSSEGGEPLLSCTATRGGGEGSLYCTPLSGGFPSSRVPCYCNRLAKERSHFVMYHTCCPLSPNGTCLLTILGDTSLALPRMLISIPRHLVFLECASLLLVFHFLA